MPILPEEVTRKKFARVYGQGYDRAEVDGFLAEVAADYKAAIDKMVRLSQGPTDVGEEVNAIIRTTKESMDALMQKAEQEAEAIQRVAAEKAATIDFEAHETQARAREQAYREAKQMTAEAEEYARALRDQTQRDCQLLIQEAEARRQQLVTYNQQLHQHLEAIERLVGALRGEVERPELVWSEGASAGAVRAAGSQRVENEAESSELQSQGV